MHGMGALYAPNAVVFCPLLKKTKGNPYLKSLDLSKLLVAIAPENNKRIKIFNFTALGALLLWTG